MTNLALVTIPDGHNHYVKGIMLDSVLKFFSVELNAYLQAQTGILGDPVELSAIVKEDGKYAIKDDHIGVSIINLEEESATREQLPQVTYQDGQHVVLEPPLKMNVYLMFAAHYTHYDQAIKYLSHVLTFFQARRVFTRERYASLDSKLERLVVELQRLDYEQLNQVWAFIGAKQLPSAVYRIRLVCMQEEQQSDVRPPVLNIHARVGGS